MIRGCLVCGAEFKAWPYLLKMGRGKYCSRTCVALARTTKTQRECLVCGEEFETVPSRVKRGYGKYCSKQCMGVANRGEIIQTTKVVL